VDETAVLITSGVDRGLAHRRAAQDLEIDDEDLESAALHWLGAGERSRAAAAFAHVGRQRLRRAQADAATRCAVRALLAVDPRDELAHTLAARIRLLADALQASRRIAERDVLTGFERHVTLPANVGRSNAARTIAHVALDACFEALRASEHTYVLADGLARGARALAALSDFIAARELLAEATEIANDSVCARWVLYESAKVAQLSNEFGSVVDIVTTTILPADKQERFELLTSLARASAIVDGREALARTRDLIARAEALAVELGGDPVSLAHCAKSRVLCFGFARENRKAVESAEEAIALSRRTGLRYEECSNLHNVGDGYVRLGERDRARSALVESSALAGDIGAEAVGVLNEMLLAYLDAEPSRIEELADACAAKGDYWLELHARYWFARGLADDRDVRALRELVGAREMARRLRVRLVADECDRALAEL
jgi:hypothetical protein